GLEDAVGGRGRFFLVVGEAGIGKTRLAEELAREAAERGGVALWGRCWEGEGAPPYWPWVQVIRALLQGVPAEELRPAVGAGAPSRRRSAGARRRCSSVPSIGRPRAIPSSSTRSCACSLPSERSSGTRTRARGGFRCRRACARRSAAASRPCRRPPGRPLRSH